MYPLAVESITRGRYVDDIFGGADSKDELVEVARQLCQLCMASGFPLAKWYSTEQELLQTVSTKQRKDQTISFDDCKSKILGITWIPNQNVFQFSTISAVQSQKYTKRLVISEVSQIFDPLGLVSPVVVKAKIFVQELWLHDFGWDTVLPSILKQRWTDIREELTKLAGISISRWFNTNATSRIELHGFADASQFAMAAVVYLVVRSTSAGAKTSLICSKTKIAPLKRLTIPRLELTAALLLSKLVKHVRATLDMEITEVNLWTDSKVTLSLIKTHPSRWKDYVRNRVIQIQELTEHAQCRHVPGTSNPADCASRGISTEQLEGHSLWWTGPPWISKSRDNWPVQTSFIMDDLCAQESRTTVALHTALSTKDYSWDLIYKCGTWKKLLTVTALWTRLIKKLSKRYGPIIPASVNSADMEAARYFWVKATQSAFFEEELKSLRNGSRLSTSHPLCRLTAFVDQQGIIRVGGRLGHSTLMYENKHPEILPLKSRLTNLIIAHAHERTMHGGTQSTLAYIRQLYWIVGGRAPVKSHILRCVKCARQRGIRAQQLMGQLPQCRVTPSRAFAHTGLDHAGPITLKTWKGRGAKTYKGWVCVFVCLTTSAVHLEVVSDYSTVGFMSTYRRFVSRRGIPTALYSDFGTNLAGADLQLKRCFQEGTMESQRITSLLAKDRTQWHFNPPAAPHMGEKWEAAVKSLKLHMRRTVGDVTLTYEEANTLLTQIEAVLNSRPLEGINEEVEEVLTPGHFLIGTALNAVPEVSVLDVSISRLTRWQFIQQRVQQFWKLWSTQYLQQLQAISKWHHPNNLIRISSIVLVTDERLPPGKWPLAKIVSIHPGKDGLTRVVTLKTATTTLTRPITKIALLPVSNPVQPTGVADLSAIVVADGGRKMLEKCILRLISGVPSIGSKGDCVAVDKEIDSCAVAIDFS